MNGTKSPTTFLIDLTPPMMTNAVTAIMTIPVTTIGTLNELFKARRNSKRRETQQRPSRDAAHCLPLGKRSVPSLDTKKTVDPCVVYSLKPFMTFPSVSRFTNEWQPRLLRRDLSL